MGPLSHKAYDSRDGVVQGKFKYSFNVTTFLLLVLLKCCLKRTVYFINWCFSFFFKLIFFNVALRELSIL